MIMRSVFRVSLVLVFLLSHAAVREADASADHPQIVVVVRHAERGSAPPGDVALSDAGQARAEELALALAEAQVDTIVTSQFRRTRDTAAPLARARGLSPVIVQAGNDTAAHAAAVARAVRAGGKVVLVVGHSNTVPAIIGALGGPRMAELCDGEYANLFTLALTPGQPARLIHSLFGAPDPAEAGCGQAMKQ